PITGSPKLQSAAEHYRKSLQLDPRQPRCLGEFGLLALRLGQTEEGLTCLRRAVELAPDDADAVGRLVKGLEHLDGPDEARAILRAALFRNPRDSRFRKLWNDFRFQQLREAQETERHRKALVDSAGDGPVLLPFVRPEPGTEQVQPGGKRVRRDAAS